MADVHEQLESAGLIVEGALEFGRLVRCKVEGDRGGKRSGWYVLHEIRLDNGETAVVGRYGNWRKYGDQALKIELNRPSLSAEERQRLQAEQRRLRDQARREKEQRAADAAKRSARIFEKLPESGASAYLDRKKVRAFGLRFSRGSIVVPVQRVDGDLVGLQFIGPDGDKKFLTGTPKRGAFHLIGQIDNTSIHPVVIAEGYATAASIHMATDYPVVVAFDAGNLLPVAQALRAMYPQPKFVVAADNDAAGETNAGLLAAQAVAREIENVEIAWPDFTGREPGTDFNDLHVTQGIYAVKMRMQWCRDDAGRSFPLREEISPRPSLERAPDIDIPLDAYVEDLGGDARLGRYDPSTLLAKFWLVYGTDTVWDGVNRLQMRLSHFRHVILKEAFRDWEQSPLRRIVRGIRFEPGQELGEEWVNLYAGFEMKPDSRGADGCERIRAHLWRLCRQREEEFFWLLKWIAYPLQNPGAKMATSVVMYGSEGPGKSIIWEKVVKRIYGEYGITIGQAQLDSSFTGWQSKRLFALAEEVVNRAERSHHKGALKHLVTGSTLMINEKNLPEREEGNHLNFVFLSNSTIPLELDYGDRRYMVLYCDDVPELQYFVDLANEIDGGGVEAFYQYLLDLDLSDFGPHSKPPLNQEKQNLINAGLSSPLYFLQEWQDGALDVPYGAVQVSDLWRAFQQWSEQSNEFKRKRRDFEGEIRRRCRFERTMISYPTPSSYSSQRFWVPPGAIDANVERSDYLRIAGEQCRAFSETLGKSARPQEG